MNKLRSDFQNNGGVVGGFFFASGCGVYCAGTGSVRRFGGQEEVIDAQAQVLLPSSGLIIPEGVGTGIGVLGAEDFRVALVENFAVGRAALRKVERVLFPALRVIDI